MLDTTTLTFILALATFIGISLGPIITSRQAHLDRLEQRRIEQEKQREVLRLERVAHLAQEQRALISLYSQLEDRGVAESGILAEIIGTILSVDDDELRGIANQIRGAEYESIRKSVERGIARMAHLRNEANP